MRILFVADGRSPTAINWIRHFVDQKHEVHLVSTYACEVKLSLASIHFVPVAFSSAAVVKSDHQPRNIVKRLSTARLRTKIRQLLGPFTIPRAADQLESIIHNIQPDLVHAMRIPFEGMLAARALKKSKIPLLVSVWGNDFTLHATASPLMAFYTRSALARTDALHTDTQRDQKLARRWGFLPDKPSVVLPGGGGIDSQIFYPLKTPTKEAIIINPRGVRSYIRNDTFFQAIPLVLEKFSNTKFICPAMEGEKEAEAWISKLKINSSVELLPLQTRGQMASLYRRSQIAVSISEHDGTPNTLLEAMACGCFPIAGDIESLREWIKPARNGLLVPYDDPKALALAILQVLENIVLRTQVVQYNLNLVSKSANKKITMSEAEKFYLQISN